jgi:hypothetical protein
MSEIKEISDIQSSLHKIRHAMQLDDARPKPPTFGGEVRSVPRADLCDIEELGLDTSKEDVRSQTQLFDTLNEKISDEGFEALAWYSPFHVSRLNWGIYIPLTSIHYVSEHWFGARISYSRRRTLALGVLLAHEIVHFSCEYAVSQIELLLRAPCWMPANKIVNGAGLGWFDDEEALANANSIRCLRNQVSPSVLRCLHDALLASPRGYRDFPAALSEEGFKDHQLEVLRHNVGIVAEDLGIGFLDQAFDALSFYPDAFDAYGICPVHYIDDIGNFDVPQFAPKSIDCIPDIQETNRFQRQLRKLEPKRQKEWLHRKEEMAKLMPKFPRFKKLKGKLKGMWGLYLKDGFRVHLRHQEGGIWEAIEIGPHTAMGHD